MQCWPATGQDGNQISEGPDAGTDTDTDPLPRTLATARPTVCRALHSFRPTLSQAAPNTGPRPDSGPKSTPLPSRNPMQRQCAWCVLLARQTRAECDANKRTNPSVFRGCGGAAEAGGTAGPVPAHPPDRVRLRQHHPSGGALLHPRHPRPAAVRGCDARAGEWRPMPVRLWAARWRLDHLGRRVACLAWVQFLLWMNKRADIRDNASSSQIRPSAPSAETIAAANAQRILLI